MKKLAKTLLKIVGILLGAFVALFIIFLVTDNGGDQVETYEPVAAETEYRQYGRVFGEDRELYEEWLNNHVVNTIDDHGRFFEDGKLSAFEWADLEAAFKKSFATMEIHPDTAASALEFFNAVVEDVLKNL